MTKILKRSRFVEQCAEFSKVWADSEEVQGLVRSAGFSVLDELLARSRRVEGLKYQERATNVVGVALEVERLRTSSSWYPCRS